ncbi:hypothetical protein PAMP_018279 [Pampus punctatissimus]
MQTSLEDWLWNGQNPLQLETAHPLASHLNSSCSEKPLPQGPPGGVIGILGGVVAIGLIIGVAVTVFMVHRRQQKTRTETDNDLIAVAAVADSCVTQAPEKPESPTRKVEAPDPSLSPAEPCPPGSSILLPACNGGLQVTYLSTPFCPEPFVANRARRSEVFKACGACQLSLVSVSHKANAHMLPASHSALRKPVYSRTTQMRT